VCVCVCVYIYIYLSVYYILIYLQTLPDDFDIKQLINHILKKADAENKRARTMDIDDFIRYK